MFNRKLKQKFELLKTQFEFQENELVEHWKYIKALLDAEKQNRKDLNTVISKVNQMKPKGNK